MPTTRSARNGSRHGPRSGPFALLPGEDHEEFAALHAAVTADWGPRDAYERCWVMELVTSMWRQDRLRGLELAVLAAAEQESPPSEATVKKLGTFATAPASTRTWTGSGGNGFSSTRRISTPRCWAGSPTDGCASTTPT